LAFKKMGYDKKQLRKLAKPLDGFGGKRIKPAGVITLPVSFLLDYSIRAPLAPSVSPRFYGWSGRGGFSSMVPEPRP
jgi:hypothetical protein